MKMNLGWYNLFLKIMPIDRSRMSEYIKESYKALSSGNPDNIKYPFVSSQKDFLKLYFSNNQIPSDNKIIEFLSSKWGKSKSTIKRILEAQ